MKSKIVCGTLFYSLVRELEGICYEREETLAIFFDGERVIVTVSGADIGDVLISQETSDVCAETAVSKMINLINGEHEDENYDLAEEDSDV